MPRGVYKRKKRRRYARSKRIHPSLQNLADAIEEAQTSNIPTYIIYKGRLYAHCEHYEIVNS